MSSGDGGHEDDLRQVILEVIEGDIPLTDLMAGLEIKDPNVFMEMCRGMGIPDDQLVAKIKRDRAALASRRS